MQIIGRGIVWLVSATGFLIALVGGGLLLTQFGVWLKSGTFPNYNLHATWDYYGFSWPHTEWVGQQRLIDEGLGLLLRLPIWLALVIVGFAVIAFGTQLSKDFGLDPYSQAKMARKKEQQQ